MKKKALRFVYDAPWEVVILAFDNKFWELPNPLVPELIETTFSDPKVDSETQVVSFRRSAKLELTAPKWLLRLIGSGDYLELASETEIDRHNRSFTTFGRNITCREKAELDEIAKFVPDPEKPSERTILTLNATMNIHIWGASAIELFVLPMYTRISNEARRFEASTIQELKEEYQGKPFPLTQSETTLLKQVFHHSSDPIKLHNPAMK